MLPRQVQSADKLLTSLRIFWAYCGADKRHADVPADGETAAHSDEIAIRFRSMAQRWDQTETLEWGKCQGRWLHNSGRRQPIINILINAAAKDGAKGIRVRASSFNPWVPSHPSFTASV